MNRKNADKKKLTLSWRIGLPHWDTDEAFDRMLKLMKKHRPIVDEVALFETITHHLYIPLDVYERRMELAAQRLATFRHAGIPVAGINVLCTIGHINEGWSYMPPLPFQAMVGHDGLVSTGSACPNSPEMLAYVRRKYELVAGAAPDFIWVDDDIRMHHHGVAWGCFCPTCLRIFAKRTGRKYSRETLVKAFDKSGERRLRRLWVEQNIETIESLLAHVASAIHKVDPKIVSGFMTTGPGWTTYSGQALDRWFTALHATKARPGGGFYSDATPIDMYRKAIECGWQRASLPAAVTDVQYEVENFPYQRLSKSTTAVANECTLALAHGHNGIAFNMLGAPGTEEDFLPWIERIPSIRPLWEALVAHSEGMPTAGLWTAWSSHLMARRSVGAKERWLDWSRSHDISRPKILGEIGLPLASDAPGCGTVLCGRVAEAFSSDELKNMLSGGVIMDSTTLDVLAKRGLDHLAGVRIAKRLDNGLMERFTNDKLNGAAVGQIRDARIEFWGDAKGMGDVLEPVADNVRILATIEDYFYQKRGPCMTAFENELRGRVVVMGYAPWMFLQSVAKRLQLQNAADWITRGTMPLRIDQAVPLIPVVRQSADRRRATVVLLNAGMDTIPLATVHFRIAARRARLLTARRADRVLKLKSEKSGARVALKNIQPWSLLVILLDT